VGTVAVYDCNGSHVGCVTPNDAEKFKNSQIVPPEGYVKVFHPTTGDYLGNMTPAQAIELLNFLNGDGVIVVPEITFTVTAPIPSPSGYTELMALVSDDDSPEVTIEILRSNMTEAIAANITGTSEAINFVKDGNEYPVGEGLYINSNEDSLTISFTWGNAVMAGTHFFNVTLTSSTTTRVVPFALILS